MCRPINWSEDKLEYLRRYFPTTPAIDIADVIGCSYTSVYNKARQLGLKKSPDYSLKDFNYRYVKDYKNYGTF
jgi:hypothetical protein